MYSSAIPALRLEYMEHTMKYQDEMKIHVAKKAENPFTPGTKVHRRAAAVLRNGGQTVAKAKARGADTWIIAALEERKLARVERRRGRPARNR